MRTFWTATAFLAISLCLSGCGGSSSKKTPTTPAPIPYTAVPPGFSLSVWVTAPSSNQKPDSIVQMGSNIFIGYQMSGDVKDGSNPSLTNAVVEYDLKGNIVKTFTVPGHVDGLMARSDTNEMWCMANEDGNPELTIINLGTGNQRTLQATVNPTPHGGGYDDMQFLGGVVYVSASNPTPLVAAPSVGALTFNPNGTTFDVAPVLGNYGYSACASCDNAMATDITPSVGGSPNLNFGSLVPLTLSDPDSMAIDSTGTRLVLDSQADGKLIFIKNPGLNSQTASVLSLTLYNDKDGPTLPVDDTRFVPAPGSTGVYMLFTDATNTTYRVDGPFIQGDPYSNGQGQVMQLDLNTGHLTPFVAGVGLASVLQDPHGMLFVPF